MMATIILSYTIKKNLIRAITQLGIMAKSNDTRVGKMAKY
jgi:hypothetical protein